MTTLSCLSRFRPDPILRAAAIAAALIASVLATLECDAAVRGPRYERVSSILWSCNVTFKAEGRALRVGLGFTKLRGKGDITCFDFLTGATQRIPIRVQAEGPGVGIGVTSLTLAAAATGIGISSSPESLLGRYLAVRADAAIGVGVGAAAGLKISRGSISLDVALQTETGLGVGADIVSVDLERDDGRGEENIVHVAEGQPVHIVDANGRLLQVISLRRR